MAEDRKPLRTVKPDERKPAPAKPQTVVEAISGSARDVFVAMQARIAKAIDDPNIRGADLAALTRRLHELRKEIEAIDTQEGDDEIGDAAATPDEVFRPESL